MTNQTVSTHSEHEEHTPQKPAEPKDKDGMQQNDDPGSAPESGDKEPE